MQLADRNGTRLVSYWKTNLKRVYKKMELVSHIMKFVPHILQYRF